ncbi:prepilin-type N-terminal cleavage/methylation domain-containing protein [Clostridium chromiireducens]|uniref:Prepilin-type N-terminal cleavage/methylation domain-containing protein n=1 Tax=Clostridium chromiireducens TaxID=225345 RepID=A0A964RJA5_9CLOT|nr:prepilin-type N-terminal cleavage/methylation domain-containing protein [Clostridium chromiireducens]MVX62576.1 prepilin-type N-terminal cleavage/methylation domain-containing protein [Clostridium chromiireducens]
MKRNSKKHEGFTLVEIIISLALIAIISAGVYNGYVLLIRHTKEGEVKQSAALAGKRAIEGIKSISTITKVDGNIILRQDNKDIELSKPVNLSEDYYSNQSDLLKLDKDFNICNDQSNNDYSYTQEIILKPIKEESGTKDISIDKNNKSNNSSNNILQDNLHLSKIGNEVYIRDTNNSNDNKKVENNADVIRIYIYIETKNSNEKFLRVKDSQGNNLLEKELGSIITDGTENEINLYINFKDYKKERAGDILKNVEINVTNKNEEEKCETNIYLQKSSDLNVKVNFDEGQGYTYDNQAEDNGGNYEIGTLYDTKVEIKKKGSTDSLFTGYSTQNINVN